MQPALFPEMAETEQLPCFSLRDSGEKSFSKKKCERRASHFRFALYILSESLAQATEQSEVRTVIFLVF